MLLPAGALLVHQLRYLLTYGSSASDELSAQGHAYFASLVPWIVLLTAGGLGWFVARLARAPGLGIERVRARPFLRLWLTTGAGLVGIYVLQEFLEGLFADGHPAELVGIFGHGGWWAVPAAAAVGFLIVAALRVGQVLARLVARSESNRRVRNVVGTLRMPDALLLVAGSPLADAAAGRAPPVLSAG